jgi:hypothetical protein
LDHPLPWLQLELSSQLSQLFYVLGDERQLLINACVVDESLRKGVDPTQDRVTSTLAGTVVMMMNSPGFDKNGQVRNHIDINIARRRKESVLRLDSQNGLGYRQTFRTASPPFVGLRVDSAPEGPGHSTRDRSFGQRQGSD